MSVNEKWSRKYLRMARSFGEDSNPCYSRHIGSIIVDPVANKVLGMGLNGPPTGTPHCDDPKYLAEIVWPQLTDSEVRVALRLPHDCEAKNSINRGQFVEKFSDCKQCPRRIIGAPSGKRTELCTCQHSERNAITNARQSVQDAWIFCWCTVPCDGCTGAIIQSGIKKVICLHSEPEADYSFSSRWQFKHAGVEVELRDPNTLDIVAHLLPFRCNERKSMRV